MRRVAARRPEGGYSKLLVQRFGCGSERALPEVAEGRVLIRAADALLERTAGKTCERTIGLKCGRSSLLGQGGAIDYAMRSAKTVEHALGTLARFIRVLNGDLKVQILPDDETVTARFDRSAPMPAAVEDFLLSALYTVHIAHFLPPSVPLECWFTQAPPEDPEEHAKTFARARLRFGAPYAAFVFARAALATPLATRDPNLYRVAVESLERELRELPETDSYAQRVWTLLMFESPLVSHTLPRAANALRITPRTLTRRLQQEETSFWELLERVRQARAVEYLGEDRLSMRQIAETLGFKVTPAFYRAFRRWTGMAPGQYRKTRLQTPSTR